MKRNLISVRLDGPVAHVELNRPEMRNAFDERLVAELTAWAESWPENAGTRVVVLRGAGSTFCAGADLTWMSRMVGFSRQENLSDAMRLAGMYEALNGLPVPLIGRIHGAAMGGGAGLAAVCDVAIAAEQTVFSFSEVKLGLLPGVISPYVVAKIGESAARELFLTGARFSAARALEIGLVHAVVPEAALDAAVDACVTELLTSAPEAIAAAKALIARVARRPPGEVIGTTADAIATRRASSEGQEGMRAFLEKRKPSWCP